MSSHEKLSAAANDRKARLAQLKSLKRKQAPDADGSEDAASESTSTALTRTEQEEDEPSVTSTYLSGRNFDSTTRNVKLGFEGAPIGDQTKTLEYKAEQLALESRKQQEEEKTEDKPLDLFKLQPKKPNWDLKRDLEAKMKPVDIQTENAIARLVRDRVEGQKKERTAIEDNANGEKQEVGMEGSELVEAMHLKEKEEEEERRRDAEDEDAS